MKILRNLLLFTLISAGTFNSLFAADPGIFFDQLAAVHDVAPADNTKPTFPINFRSTFCTLEDPESYEFPFTSSHTKLHKEAFQEAINLLDTFKTREACFNAIENFLLERREKYYSAQGYFVNFINFGIETLLKNIKFDNFTEYDLYEKLFGTPLPPFSNKEEFLAAKYLDATSYLTEHFPIALKLFQQKSNVITPKIYFKDGVYLAIGNLIDKSILLEKEFIESLTKDEEPIIIHLLLHETRHALDKVRPFYFLQKTITKKIKHLTEHLCDFYAYKSSYQSTIGEKQRHLKLCDSYQGYMYKPYPTHPSNINRLKVSLICKYLYELTAAGPFEPIINNTPLMQSKL